MFEPNELQKVLDLANQSYQLLLWINRQVKHDKSMFHTIHGGGSAFSNARDWLGKNASQFPNHLRPESTEFDRFAHLLVSYLQTSLEFYNGKYPEIPSVCGCCFCGSLLDATFLRTKSSGSSNDRQSAYRLKLLFLKQLSEEQGIALLDSELETFMGQSKEIGLAVSYGTYVSELYRRTEFASQGGGVYLLWNELKAVHGKRLIKLLEVAPILENEKLLADQLKAFANQI